MQFHPQFLIDPQPVNMSTQSAPVHKHDFEELDAKKPKVVDGRVEAVKIKIDQLQVEMQANIGQVGVKSEKLIEEMDTMYTKQIEGMHTTYMKLMGEMWTMYKKQIEGMHTKYKMQIEQNVLMDTALTDHFEVLRDITRWSRGSREIFLEREISETLIEFIVQGIYYVLKAFCPINIYTEEKVEKHKEELEKFTDPRTSFASKKKILTSEETGEAIFFIIRSSFLPFLANYNYLKKLSTQKFHFE